MSTTDISEKGLETLIMWHMTGKLGRARRRDRSGGDCGRMKLDFHWH